MVEIPVSPELVQRHLPDITIVSSGFKEGAYKRTFRGQWRGCPVAVQVHDPITTRDERFQRECAALKAVDSPNVAKLLDIRSFEEDGLLFNVFLCAWIDGETLDERIKAAGPMGRADLLQFARGMTQGLVDIHKQRIVHRDIKPQNILIEGHTHNPMILDLGVARHLDRETLTTSGRLMGTRPWMAPEQLRAEKHVDRRVDLFALGLVLYFAGTGRHAFGDDPEDGILHREPLPLGAPQLGADLSLLVGDLLSKKAYQRPRTAALVLERLKDMEA